jgi:hypothetical protein
VVLPDKVEPSKKQVEAEINNQPLYFEQLPPELQGTIVSLAPGETLKVLNLVSRSLHKLVSGSEKFKKYSDFVNRRQEDFKKLAALKHKACCLFAAGCIFLAVKLGLVATIVVDKFVRLNDVLFFINGGCLLVFGPVEALALIRCCMQDILGDFCWLRTIASTSVICDFIDAFKAIKAYKVLQKQLLHDMNLSQFGEEMV